MKRRAFLGVAAGLAATRIQAAESTVRIALLGDTGRGNYGHGLDTMWREVPGTKVVAVADADPGGLAEAQARMGDIPGFADYRELLDRVRPDVAVIAPRHIDQHHAMAMAAAAAGVRGIYMEKPFCRSLAEADEIIAACDRSGLRLALAHRNRHHPALPVVKALVLEGRIGRVLEYRARGKEDTRGGSLDLWVLGCHLFNLIHHFAGEPQSCTASVLQQGRPLTAADVGEGAEGIGPLGGNEVHARFEMADGLPAFFDSVQNAGVRESGFGLQIIGTEGVIDLRIDAEPLIHLRTGSPFRPDSKSSVWQPVTSAGLGKPESLTDIRKQVGGHLAPALDLLAAMKEERDPLCSARDGRVTLEMICGVFASHVQNGRRVKLPLAERGNPLQSW